MAKKIFIKNQMGGTLTYTSTEYDILILGESYGVQDNGRVISVYGDSDALSDTNIERFNLTLSGKKAMLSLAGNFSADAPEYTDFYPDSSKAYQTFAGPSSITLESNYNLHHFAHNVEETTGAVHYTGTLGQLYIESQAGSERANLTRGGKTKSDDAMRVLSENYGIYTIFNSTRRNSAYDDWMRGGFSPIVFGKNALTYASTNPVAPNLATCNYTILADNDLHVTSTLAGTYESLAAAVHTGYMTKTTEGKWVANDDCSGATLSSGVIRSENGTVEFTGNVRAELASKIDKDSFNAGREYFLADAQEDSEDFELIYDQACRTLQNDMEQSWQEYLSAEDEDIKNAALENYNDAQKKLADVQTAYEQGKLDDLNVFRIKTEFVKKKDKDGKETEVTQITDFVPVTSSIFSTWTGASLSDTSVYSAAVSAGQDIVQTSGVWAGTLSVSASDTIFSVNNDYRYKEKGKIGNGNASFSNVHVSAYGLQADGAITLHCIDALPGAENPSIRVDANNNRYELKSNQMTEKSPNACFLTNCSVTAAAISANSIRLDEVGSSTSLVVTLENNKEKASVTNGTVNTLSLALTYGAYGLYAADSVSLGKFHGSITINSTGNSLGTSGSTTIQTPVAKAAAVYSENTLTVDENLGGTWYLFTNGNGSQEFTDNFAYGVYARDIEVAGNISASMQVYGTNSFGLFATHSLKAQSIAGSITANSGISVQGAIGTGNSQDALDIAGSISYNRIGIASTAAINIRISGNITGGSTAICAEYALQGDSRGFVTPTANNDSVEVASFATVNGLIELGRGNNSFVLHSGARINGGLTALGGSSNITFQLEESNLSGTTLLVYSEDDETLFSTHNLTLNLNYAENGTYRLIQYALYNPQVRSIADEHWTTGQATLSLVYQGESVNLVLDTVNDGTASGTRTVTAADGTEFQVTADYNNGQLSIDIANAGDDPARTLRSFLTKTELEVSAEYDHDAGSCTVSWTGIQAEEYGLAQVGAYELEYRLVDKDGNLLGTSENATVVARIAQNQQDSTDAEGNKLYKYTIHGVEEDAEGNVAVQYRLRVDADHGASVLEWTDWTNYQTHWESSHAFDLSHVSTSAVDASLFEERQLTGIASSLATLGWEGIATQDGTPIQDYTVEYIILPAPITLQEATAAGFATVDEYIAGENGLIDSSSPSVVYTKTVTGDHVDVSGLPNQGVCYWRLKARDIQGYESDWLAGSAFRIWTMDDYNAPVFENKESYGLIGLGYTLPDDSQGLNPDQQTALKGALVWNPATDTESGVRYYQLVLTNSITGEEERHLINAENQIPRTEYRYEDAELQEDGWEYSVVINGTEIAAKVVTSTVGGKVRKELLWDAKGEAVTGDIVILARERGSKTPTEWKTVTAGEGGYTATAYAYSFELSSLTGGGYSYAISAIDHYGNTSETLRGSFTADRDAPRFISRTLNIRTVEDWNGETPRLLPEVSWSHAMDGAGTGVRYYEVFCRKAGEEEWGKPVAQILEDGSESYSWQTASGLAATRYEVRVVAYDYFGNSTELTDAFGRMDVMPPKGQFLSFAQPRILIERATPPTQTNTSTDSEESEEQEVGQITSVSVNFSWQDNFTDESGVIYRLTISDDPLFQSARTYSFWTTVEDGKGLTLDNAAVGRPVGILEGMNTVYWYVSAADTEGNLAEFSGPIQSFAFTDETGAAIVAPDAPTAPIVSNINMERQNDVQTGVFDISWIQPGTPLLGLYGYEITLTDTKGKIVLRKNTVDLLADAPTDLDANVEYADGVYTLHDVLGWGGVSQPSDGEYKLTIAAFDAYGRTSVSETSILSLDTTAPSSPANLQAGALPSGSDCILALSWDKAKDASGILGYDVQYRVKDDTRENPENWSDATTRRVTGNSLEIITNAPTLRTYEWRVRAIDSAGNYGQYIQGKDVRTTRDSFPQLPEEALVYSFNENNRLSVADVVGKNDGADCFALEAGSRSARLNVSLDSVAVLSGNEKNASLKIEIFEQNNLKKAFQTFTLKGQGAENGSILLKTDNQYVIRVTSSDTRNTVLDYNLNLQRTYFGSAETNSSADDVPDAMAIWDKSLTLEDWVGFGDAMDYRAVTLDYAQTLAFDLKATDAAKFTVYSLQEKTDKKGNVTYSLKALQATTLKLDKETEDEYKYGATTKALLLEKGTYYVAMQSTNAAKGGNAYYTVNEHTEGRVVYDNRDASSADDWTDMKTAGAASSFVGSWDNITTPLSGWVGFGDAVDYRAVTLETGGVLSFKLTAGDAAKFTVYALQEKKDKSGNVISCSLKSLQSTVLKPGKEAATKQLALDAGTYYVAVESTNAKKGGKAQYSVELNGSSILSSAVSTKDDTWKAVAALEDAVEHGTGDDWDDWTGFGDKADFFKLAAGDGAPLEITLDVTGVLPADLLQESGDLDESELAALAKKLKLSLTDGTTGKAVKLSWESNDAGRLSAVCAAEMLSPDHSYYLGVTNSANTKANIAYHISLG